MSKDAYVPAMTDKIPQQGDIIIWGSQLVPYGHTEFVPWEDEEEDEEGAIEDE